MIRESLTGESRHGMVVVTAGVGYAFQRRLTAGDYSLHQDAGYGSAPGWVRLVRRGDRFEAFRSSDRSSWTAIGAYTIAMGATVYVGLAVTSHNADLLTTAVIDQVVVNGGAAPDPGLPPDPGNARPIVTMTSPTAGATFMAPATITLTADAVDPDGEYRPRRVFCGRPTCCYLVLAAPYTLNWTNVPAGTYTLMAVAYDSAGAITTSVPVTVSVSASALPPPIAVVFTASSDHAIVISYLLKIFPAGVDPNTTSPVAMSDLGKPAPDANNDITVERRTFFSNLAPGDYSATVTAISAGGESSSAAVSFVR